MNATYFCNTFIQFSGLGYRVYYLKKFKNLTRWYLEISEREAVKKGFSFMNKDELPPKP